MGRISGTPRRLASIAWLLLAGCRGCSDEYSLLPQLKDAPDNVRERVRLGDRHYSAAMKHLLQSDPSTNPDHWAEENMKALQLFRKAKNEGYVPAEDRYGRNAVPEPLLDRLRETVMRESLCRKRSISARR